MTLLIRHIGPHGDVLYQATAVATSIRGIQTSHRLTEIVDQDNRDVCRPMSGCKVEIHLFNDELDMAEMDTRLFQQPIERHNLAALYEQAALNER